jgi:mannose-6-phosphate isomerase-like protein (cupin superfamily)
LNPNVNIGQSGVRPRRLHFNFGLIRAIGCAVLTILVGGPTGVSRAEETVVPVYEEPMHRLVLDREPVRVLDVGLEPDETSLYHLHEDPIFYIALDISEVDAQVLGEEWKRTRVAEWQTGAVAHDLGHAEQPTVHRIRNAGSENFRLIAVTNSRRLEKGGPVPEPELPGDLETEVAYFRQSRVTLAPGAVSGRFQSLSPVVVVLVSSGEVDLVVSNSATRPLTDLGNFSHVEPGRDYELQNPGAVPVTLVVVEAR